MPLMEFYDQKEETDSSEVFILTAASTPRTLNPNEEGLKREELLSEIEKLHAGVLHHQRTTYQFQLLSESLSRLRQEVLMLLDKYPQARKVPTPTKQTRRIPLDRRYPDYCAVETEVVAPRSRVEAHVLPRLLQALADSYSALLKEQMWRRRQAEENLSKMRKTEDDLRLTITSRQHFLQEQKTRRRIEQRKSIGIAALMPPDNSPDGIFHRGYLCRKEANEWVDEFYVLYYDHTLRTWPTHQDVIFSPPIRTVHLVDASVSPCVRRFNAEQPLLFAVHTTSEDILYQAATLEHKQIWADKLRLSCIKSTTLNKLAKGTSVAAVSADLKPQRARSQTMTSNRSSKRFSLSWSAQDASQLWKIPTRPSF
eukprot:TRINITY_DN30998_c0_g1_i1.p1 TRINITY_DN30998_c0_g1~~TRINITY_DN30998_c0_g1_i1.p1  ORF type:complete len:368 (+),score=56.76 TRINITY_DN30998_c0_g1_i1:116-1219(+)